VKKCTSCHYYQWCLSLCKKAAAYVSQDEIKQRELPIGIPQYSPPFPFMPSPISLTESQRRIGRLLAKNISRENTASLMGISRKTLRNQIFQMKHKYYNED
jgi:hypothetical protein